jgi:hypothetical protein
VRRNIHNPHYFEWRRDNHNYERLHTTSSAEELTTRFLNRFYRFRRVNPTDELKQYETRFVEIIRKIIEFKDYEIRANNVNIVREQRTPNSVSARPNNRRSTQNNASTQRKNICKGETSPTYTPCSSSKPTSCIDYPTTPNPKRFQTHNSKKYTKKYTEIESLKTYTNNCLIKLEKCITRRLECSTRTLTSLNQHKDKTFRQYCNIIH